MFVLLIVEIALWNGSIISEQTFVMRVCCRKVTTEEQVLVPPSVPSDLVFPVGLPAHPREYPPRLPPGALWDLLCLCLRLGLWGCTLPGPRECPTVLCVHLHVWRHLTGSPWHFFPQLIDYRAIFSRWWAKEMRAVKFPSQGTVFDYFVDPNTKKFTHWSENTPSFELEADIPLQVVNRSLTVPLLLVIVGS